MVGLFCIITTTKMTRPTNAADRNCNKKQADMTLSAALVPRCPPLPSSRNAISAPPVRARQAVCTAGARCLQGGRTEAAKATCAKNGGKKPDIQQVAGKEPDPARSGFGEGQSIEGRGERRLTKTERKGESRFYYDERVDCSFVHR